MDRARAGRRVRSHHSAHADTPVGALLLRLRICVLAVACLFGFTACSDSGPPGPAERSADVGACLGPDTDPDVPGYGTASAYKRLEPVVDPDFSDLDIDERFERAGRPGEMLRLRAFPGLDAARANSQEGWVLHEVVVERLATEVAAGSEILVPVWLDPAPAQAPLGEGVPFVVARRTDGETVMVGDCAASMAERLVEPLLDKYGEELELDDDLVEFFNRVGDPEDPAHERYVELTNVHRFDRHGDD